MSLKDILSIRTKKADVNSRLEESEQALKKVLSEIKERFNDKKSKIERGHDLAPGVIKIVKVFLAIKRRIQHGDKIDGRH